MSRIVLAPLLFALVLAEPVSAAHFTVTSTASVGGGTLYQALTDAATSPGPHTISFNVPANSHINMAHSLPPIVSNQLTIDGSSVPGLIIDGGGAVRLFLIGSANTVFRLAGVEVRGGHNVRAGGCLLAQTPTAPTGAVVTLDRVVMRDCEATRSPSNEFVYGGAVHIQFRDVTVLDSQFLGNQAVTDDAALATIASGGAISVEMNAQHLLRVEDSIFLDNRVTGAAPNGIGCCRASGAAVNSLGTGVVTLTRNRFINNYADTLDQSSTWGDVIKTTTSTVMNANLLFGNDNLGSMIYIDAAVPAGSFVRVLNNSLVANSSSFGAALQVVGVAATEIRNNTFLAWYGTSFPVPHLRILPPPNLTATAVLSHNLFGPADSHWPDPTRPICVVHADIDVSHHHNLLPGFAQRCGPMLDPEQVDLRVEALRDNGGSIETVSFLQGSPALDGGNPLAPSNADTSRCATTDARTRPRPRDGDGDGIATCDIGAWESDGEAALFRHDFERVLWRPIP